MKVLKTPLLALILATSFSSLSAFGINGPSSGLFYKAGLSSNINSIKTSNLDMTANTSTYKGHSGSFGLNVGVGYMAFMNSILGFRASFNFDANYLRGALNNQAYSGFFMLLDASVESLVNFLPLQSFQMYGIGGFSFGLISSKVEASGALPFVIVGLGTNIKGYRVELTTKIGLATLENHRSIPNENGGELNQTYLMNSYFINLSFVRYFNLGF
ncbi:hypothetical protein BKH43_00885 [Helicobacter sp. 13S00401-1]|uniref:hypothetical protein n=1 Tax=Helicobacter sp. 13S00401-1 TaxID=1905758 RepID=UPI000BA5C8A0|nr:hypothetical protein [Helicobacter sp. 13S00401-1]PAF51820.1 hypothetical protein BKH43_00885 [Helicobacter sp. 13S00401-1]